MKQKKLVCSNFRWSFNGKIHSNHSLYVFNNFNPVIMRPGPLKPICVSHKSQKNTEACFVYVTIGVLKVYNPFSLSCVTIT